MNGSPTDEVQIQWGLKQGGLLAPFLFSLVEEGLIGLVRNAVSLGLFKGYKVGQGGEDVTILQYADDTLFVGEASWSNLWVMKAILR